MSKRPDFVNVFPLENLGYGIRSGYEEQVCVGTRCANIAERVNGIGRSLTVDIDATDGEPRVRRGRDNRHQVSVFPLGDVRFRFHPRLARWHKDYFVESELLLDFARSDEVTVVNGVKGSTHDPDTFTALSRFHHW